MGNADSPFLDSWDLEQRGWTKTLIDNYLGDPDQVEQGHWYNSSGKFTYSDERVETVESSSEFRTAFIRSIKRRKIGLSRVKLFLRNRKKK
jgi:hypothetical protein